MSNGDVFTAERILQKRRRKVGGKLKTEYLVKWRGYSAK